MVLEVGGKHCNVLADGEPVANLFTAPLSLSTLMRDVAMDAPGLPGFVYFILFILYVFCRVLNVCPVDHFVVL